ncbi:hypothetical protein TRV_00505 [Trichophyton verrucosum HKI 0517]|uniref:Uncharacterized protein n=1 Tax=Trichophyton verrucosum (strain HKI 0517) TaxID=663202 RepID=D4D0B0_TRIVH|nr:uncharacterized protein TRV_00505 [Trichophyton verrucosum HKI 0517]EFE44714.1 hypothetical protein TRV_00505 [Trichophyton verrucosum HKI 0517]
MIFLARRKDEKDEKDDKEGQRAEQPQDEDDAEDDGQGGGPRNETSLFSRRRPVSGCDAQRGQTDVWAHDWLTVEQVVPTRCFFFCCVSGSPLAYPEMPSRPGEFIPNFRAPSSDSQLPDDGCRVP